MEARRLRDTFWAEIEGAPAAPISRSRLTFGQLAAEWLGEQEARSEVGAMSPRTYDIYELALRRHVLRRSAHGAWTRSRQTTLVSWIRNLHAAGYVPHSVHNYWGSLHLVLMHAVRRGAIASSPADRLTFG